MISAIRAAPLRVLFLAVAVVGLMTVTDLPSASPVHAQEQAVTATRDATGESPPARPTDLQAAAGPDSVSLTWTASTDQTVTHYAVLLRDRDKAAAGVFKVIDGNAGSATSYTDRSVSPGGSYVYRVKAVSPTGVSQWSSYARADIPADPEDLAPSGLSAKEVFDGGDSAGVELAWDAPAVDAESVTGYEILRAVGDGDLATLAADTGSADTTYTDDTATEAGERYAYRVKALRGEETSQPSDRAEASIPKVTTVDPERGIAEEQSGTTAWVSNTAQTVASSVRIVLGNTDKRHSQGFTTGAEPGGYSLGSVGVYVDDEDLESGETFTVHIYTANADGAIDTLVHTLISPDSYADDAVNLFTAPADATLAPNTDYLVVFEATGNAADDFALGYTVSTSEDSGSATGWSIEDSRRFDNSLFGTAIFVISVNAAAAESAEVWSATFTPVAFSGDIGCTGEADNSNEYCSAAMTDDSFEYDGTSYTIYSLLDRTNGDLQLGLNVNPTDATIADLTLNVGGSPFPLSDATLNGSLLVWANSGLTLTAGTDVTVSLTQEATAPVVSNVDVTSDPGGDDTYAIGDTVQVTVTFDQAVTVDTSDGTPRIQLRVGGGEDEHLKWADYLTGTGAAVVQFTYIVLAGDFDDNGIDIAADKLELNGGTIQSSGGTDANLDYPDQGNQSGHNVDGVRPTPEFAATSVDGNSIIIIFSETLSATTAAASAFTLSVDTGTAPAVSTVNDPEGNTLTFGLASALTSDQVVTVTYVDATLGDDALAVQDAAGNDAANFTQTVTNNVAIVVSADWGLIPSGLAAGAEFRLIFVPSDTSNAASTDIADYNTFVQTAAASGHADIQDYSSEFRVVGSTADVDARDNTATTYTADDKGVAIYWLGGAKVADDYEDFYDGSWDEEVNVKDESGSNRSIFPTSISPYTGSNHDGTEAFSGVSSRALGASSVQVGRPNSSTSGHGPLSSDGTAFNSNTRPLYGLSPVFRVSDQVVTNTAPAFTTSAAFSTDENQRATFQVTAMDDDAGDEVSYAITGGADQTLFTIGATNGLLASATLPDHENPADADTNNVYLVTVTATGGTGARALTTDQAINVTVNDVDEPPSAPAAPTVSAVSGSSDSLSVTWTAPGNTGKPDIQSYDLQYRKGTTGNFADGPQDVTGLTDTIGGLDADSLYQVQVRATNDEGDGAWSQSGSGTTNALAGCGTLPTDRLWSACLTVGEISSAGLYGYQASDSTGSLVPATFDVGMTAYTVTVLTDNDNIGGFTGIKMTLQPALAAADASGLTLHLGDDTSLSFADATADVFSTISQFRWTLSAALGWSTDDAIVVGITQEEQVNTDPSFLLESSTREVAENSAAGVDVGGPVTAVDTDTGDTLTYTLEGTDAASFNIVSTSGQIQTKAGVTYDHESQPEYSVTVKADDGNGGTDTIAVTIDIADVDEPPSAPAAPTVSAVSGTTDSLEVTWTAPDNTGPAISSYDLQYRKGTPDSWIDGPQDETGTTATIDGLDADSLYQVQVRATNDEGDSGWSSAGSGSTNAPAEEMAETTVPADWGLIPTGLGPGDSFRLLFIGTSNRNASSSDIADYNTFVQNLVDTNGHADIKALSATFRMLGSTEDVDARDNTGTTGTGVAIYWLGGAKVADDYADFYDGDWDEEAAGRWETGASVTIGTNWKIWTGSAQDGTEAMSADATPTSRALGNSNNAWVMQGSPNGSNSAHGPIESDTIGRTNDRYVYGLSGVFLVSDQPTANNPPAFSSPASFSVEENQTDAGTVMAEDPDAVDTVTYAVTGGADQALFQIDAASGALTFATAPDHEDPADAGGNNTYMVTVTATSGTGDRAMTAEQVITVTVTDVDETPTFDGLEVTSTPKAAVDTYGRDETIEVTVTFDQAVMVTGTPRIRLRIGGGNQEHFRWANYDGGTGTTELRFTYVVDEDDRDTNGIYIQGDELELDGGTIQGVDDDVAADLDYPTQGAQSGHKVDGSLRSTNIDPAFDQESAVRDLPENTGADEYVGDPLTATDDDGDTLTYSLEGDDAGSFAINSRTGQILTREGVTYDYEDTTEYSVRVKADDGERGDATVEVAIHVIDVDEPPLAPRAPTLSDGPDDSGSLDVTWRAPDNSGRPDIESYDLRYRKSGAEDWRNGPQDVTGTSAAITGLEAGSDYQVGVRATNDEGDGEWSPTRSTTYPAGPVVEVDDNGDGVVDANPVVTLPVRGTVSYRVRPGPCEGYKTMAVQRMSGVSEGAPPHIPVDVSQEVSPMRCMGEDDPGEWQTVTLAVPADLRLELLLVTPFEASVEHSVYYRRSLTGPYSPLLLWGHLVTAQVRAAETLAPVGSLTVAPDARDYPRVTWSAVHGATDYQVQWRWGPDEKYGQAHRQEGSTYSREKLTEETAYTIPISETVPTTDEGVERSQRITVRVRPYDSEGLAVGPWREASLAERTEVRRVLAGFSLLDADGSSQGLLAALTDGATVELAYPDGGSYAIRAELVEGELAGSVHLELTGKKRAKATDDEAPYLLAGGQGMALPAGSYTLKAEAYGGPNRTYAVQDTLEVSFTVRAAASGEPVSGELNVEEEEEEDTEPLTARFEGMPEGIHGGAGETFSLRLSFSEAVSTTPEALRDHALEVTNAAVEAASRVDDRSDLWEVRLTPESDAMVTVSLLPAADCDAAGAVCTEDGRMLSGGVARVILGPPPNSPATGQPSISGTAQVGSTLTADTSGIVDEDGLDNVTFSYQWMADDANIQGATGSTYTLADRDKGKTIKVRVSFTDDANNEESLPSAATDAVAALPGKPQSLAGKATAQEIELTWKAPTGPAVVEYVVYRGTLQNGSMNGQALSKYATIDAAGKAMTYTDDNVEEGVEYRYRVAAVNADGEGKKSTWLDIRAE